MEGSNAPFPFYVGCSGFSLQPILMDFKRILQSPELEKLRIELRHLEQMYQLAQKNDINEKVILTPYQATSIACVWTIGGFHQAFVK